MLNNLEETWRQTPKLNFIIQWISRHQNIDSNEKMNQEAKRATKDKDKLYIQTQNNNTHQWNHHEIWKSRMWLKKNGIRNSKKGKKSQDNCEEYKKAS